MLESGLTAVARTEGDQKTLKGSENSWGLEREQEVGDVVNLGRLLCREELKEGVKVQKGIGPWRRDCVYHADRPSDERNLVKRQAVTEGLGRERKNKHYSLDYEMHVSEVEG